MNPDHLRAAIERIGIEKPSDYTLVMEEVGRMEAEEKLVERLRKHAESDDGISNYCADGELLREAADKLERLMSAAEAVLAAGIVNPTGSMKVANARDALVKAVREVKG